MNKVKAIVTITQLFFKLIFLIDLRVEFTTLNPEIIKRLIDKFNS